jgi:Flp pilus assembly protein TadG
MKWLAVTKSTLGQARRARHGQSLVEFAVVAPMFFLLVFGITDFGRLFFTKETLQFALREAGRYAVTGQKLAGTNPLTQNPYTRVESIKAIAQKYAAGFLPSASNIDINAYDSEGVLDVAHPAGLPSETVVVSLTSSLTLITPIIGQYFPNGVYTFKVSTSFKNEPFDVAAAD